MTSKSIVITGGTSGIGRAAALAFAAAAFGTRAMIPWLASRGALAHENERTLHHGSVPKGGGLPLLIALGKAALFALLVWFVGTRLVSKLLERKGVKHEVLNAKQHEREAVVIAQAVMP